MWLRKDGCHVIQLAAILFLISKEAELSSEYSIQVKDKIINISRSMCAIVPCKFTADGKQKYSNSKGFWKQGPDVVVAASANMPEGTKQNFHAIGNPDKGDCTLKIINASKEDNGNYYFRFEDTNDNKNKYSYINNQITVQVTDLNEKPVIADPGILTEGNKVTLTCTAPGNCPNALITWQNQLGKWTNAENLTFVPNRSHHQTSLTCRMTFPPLKDYTQNEITLSVRYSPSIIITAETSEIQNVTKQEVTVQEVTVQEGSMLVLNCSVDSNPGAQVTWMKGEKNVLSIGTGRELILYLYNIAASGADKYQCLARNKLGANNKTIHIIVKHTRPLNITMIAGITATAVIVLLLIGLGIFGFVRHKKKKESGHVTSPSRGEVRWKITADAEAQKRETHWSNSSKTFTRNYIYIYS